MTMLTSSSSLAPIWSPITMTMLTSSSSSSLPPPLSLHPKHLSTTTTTAPPIRLWFPSSSSSSSSRVLLSSNCFSSVNQISSRFIRCQALGDNSVDPTPTPTTIYQGIYGPWSVDSADVREVILYRAGLVTAATSFVIAASTAILPEDFFLTNILKQNLDLFYALGAGGLGLSLFLIHIYVTEIKRTLQALWGIGVLGSVATFIRLAQPVNQTLPQYVLDHPTAVWFVGPLFAALTGLVFKEGLCYGKLEAGILTFIIPTVLLGHLSGLMDDGLKLNLLGVWMVLFAVFAARKFTQPIKDDIGDKSVFIFNALPDNKKQALLQKLGEQKLNQDSN